MRAFLICPVRGHSPDETAEIVGMLAAEGYHVHWPPRDTDQNDSTGIRICRDNLEAIRSADLIAVVWDGHSQGVLFDLGMAFALGKPVRVIALPPATDGKSFQNMVREWAR